MKVFTSMNSDLEVLSENERRFTEGVWEVFMEFREEFRRRFERKLLGIVFSKQDRTQNPN